MIIIWEWIRWCVDITFKKLRWDARKRWYRRHFHRICWFAGEAGRSRPTLRAGEENHHIAIIIIIFVRLLFHCGNFYDDQKGLWLVVSSSSSSSSMQYRLCGGSHHLITNSTIITIFWSSYIIHPCVGDLKQSGLLTTFLQVYILSWTTSLYHRHHNFDNHPLSLTSPSRSSQLYGSNLPSSFLPGRRCGHHRCRSRADSRPTFPRSYDHSLSLHHHHHCRHICHYVILVVKVSKRRIFSFHHNRCHYYHAE